MIKLVSIDGGTPEEQVVTIFADDKAEVPATGTATTVEGFSGRMSAGSACYTSALDVAILKSDDTWNWGE